MNIWSSSDGASWAYVADGSPWSGRAYHRSVVFSSLMWVMRGMDSAGGYLNDIYNSITSLVLRGHWSPHQRVGLPATVMPVWCLMAACG